MSDLISDLTKLDFLKQPQDFPELWQKILGHRLFLASVALAEEVVCYRRDAINRVSTITETPEIKTARNSFLPRAII